MSTTVAIRKRIIERWENQLILLRRRYSFQVNKAYHKSCNREKRKESLELAGVNGREDRQVLGKKGASGSSNVSSDPYHQCQSYRHEADPGRSTNQSHCS